MHARTHTHTQTCALRWKPIYNYTFKTNVSFSLIIILFAFSKVFEIVWEIYTYYVLYYPQAFQTHLHFSETKVHILFCENILTEYTIKT